MSAWIAYWIGRELGPKLYSVGWFSRIITPKRIELLHTYYEKYGILVFIVGRFCPGGVRNALFLTSGLGKMPFALFVFRDLIACIIANATLFYIGYKFGENHEILFYYFKEYELIVGTIFIIALISLLIYLIKSKQNN
jgi:membrane protein DedA with SNARE-associated domain